MISKELLNKTNYVSEFVRIMIRIERKIICPE